VPGPSSAARARHVVTLAGAPAKPWQRPPACRNRRGRGCCCAIPRAAGAWKGRNRAIRDRRGAPARSGLRPFSHTMMNGPNELGQRRVAPLARQTRDSGRTRPWFRRRIEVTVCRPFARRPIRPRPANATPYQPAGAAFCNGAIAFGRYRKRKCRPRSSASSSHDIETSFRALQA